jgi:hypothetical protein
MRRHLEGRRHPGFFSPSPLHFFYIQGELQRLLAKGLGFGGLSIQMGFRGKARHAGRAGAGLRPGGSARERRPRRRRNRGRQEGGGRGVKKKKKRDQRGLHLPRREQPETRKEGGAGARDYGGKTHRNLKTRALAQTQPRLLVRAARRRPAAVDGSSGAASRLSRPSWEEEDATESATSKGVNSGFYSVKNH